MAKIKRFVLFSGRGYYPGGGWIDFVSSFETMEKAIAYPVEKGHVWKQVVDLETGSRWDHEV